MCATTDPAPPTMQNTSNLGITLPLCRAEHIRGFGAKAVFAGRLFRAGFVVPDGFCISSDAYRAHIWATGVRSLARNNPDESDCETLRAAILDHDIPPEIVSAIESTYSALGTDALVAVRHSASDELTAGAAYSSVLGVSGLPAVLDAVKTVWASLWNEDALDLRELSDDECEPVMSVLVQRMVDPVASGVSSSANLETGNPNHVTIQSTWGVYGGGHCDEDVVELSEFRIIRADVAHKDDLTLLGAGGLEIGPAPAELADSPSLSSAEIVELAEATLWAQKSLGFAVSVLWAHDGKGFHILGARELSAIPDYFPVPKVGGGWRLCCDGPISDAALSLIGTDDTLRGVACWNGRVYRSESDAESRKLTAKAGDRLRLEAESASRDCRRMLARPVNGMPTEEIVVGVRKSAEIAARTLGWLEQALRSSRRSRELLGEALDSVGTDVGVLDSLIGEREKTFGLESALQRLSAYAWQSQDGEARASFAEMMAAGLAETYGYSFESQAEVFDPSTWRSWLEEPEQVVRMAYALAGGPQNDVDLGIVRARLELMAAESEVFARPGSRKRLPRLVRSARSWRAAYRVAEQAHALSLSVLRVGMSELGIRFAAPGILSAPGDIFCLGLDEVGRLQAKITPAEQKQMRRAIAARKHRRWLESRLTSPETIAAMDENDVVMQLHTRKFVGVPVSGGEVTGRARTAANLYEAHALQPGEILVARQTGPAWLPLLGLAGGLVISGDGPLGSASAARLYGIPCVVAACSAADMIVNGQVISVDGSSGVVEIVSRG